MARVCRTGGGSTAYPELETVLGGKTMTTEPKVRYYLGANSPSGFYSLYDQLMDPGEAEELLILKGGAGCGKSTLMGQVAAQAEARGIPVEYIRCSGDPDSLDAIVLPDRHAAIVDGTAPHDTAPLGHPAKKVNICKGLRDRLLDGTSTGHGYLGHFYGTGIQK